MFNRKIEKKLEEWKNRADRKPLVLRGARQTGKTTIVRKFGNSFKIFIELNLEKDLVRNIFEEIKDVASIIQSIEAVSNQKIVPGETLLFLDEIQNSGNAVKILRYFYEEIPGLHVVAAGSLLEVRMQKEGWSFPVGRVEFLYLFPVSFDEFLPALGEQTIFDILVNYKIGDTITLPVHEKLIDLLADYMIVGGMPEAVAEYIKSKSFISVRRRQEALMLSFKEDFVKYSTHSEVEYLKLVWDRVPFEIGSRIKYSRLAQSNTKSKNISNAFDILHEAMLVERIFPATAVSPPLVKKVKAAPKALFLDIGLCTYSLNLTRDQVKEKILNPVFWGGLLEEMVGQELLALDTNNRLDFYFWIREEKGASSELDFLLQTGSDLVPVEVKAGGQGSLKSLHQFLYRSKRDLGVRIGSGLPELEKYKVSLPEGEVLDYRLLSIPAYLLFRLWDLIKVYQQ